MDDPQPLPPQPPKPGRAMPRQAIAAIAGSGVFCGLMSLFLAYYGWRMGFPPFFAVINGGTGIAMFVGAAWMMAKLKQA